MGVTENRIEQIQRHIRKCYSSTPKDLELGQTRFGKSQIRIILDNGRKYTMDSISHDCY
jgi:hypothetical protein